ncbi:MAG: hypothetical protein ACOY3K_00815 [Candidatus Omnitrophota bacterium]
MTLSIVVAKILALTYLSAGIAALSGRVSFGKIIEDYERSPALTFMSGFVTLILGMLLVTYHNLWVWGWPVLITLIGWIALFKGVFLIAFPQMISRFKHRYRDTRLWGILMTTIGFLFGYWGFIAGGL